MDNIIVSKKVFEANINRLTNQLWKLIPMRENGENWQGQLETVVLEIIGLNKLFSDSLDFLVLISKLKGLEQNNIDFDLYRKTIFEAISLLRGIRL